MTRPRRGRAVGVAALGGLVAGAILTLVASDPSPSASRSGSAPATNPPAEEATGPTLLVWASGGLPEGLAAAVGELALVESATVVKGGEADLVRSASPDGDVVDAVVSGWAIPIDTIAIEPSTFALFAGARARAAIEALQVGEALLTESSAALRRLDIGSVVGLETGRVEITDIIDDASGAGAELVVHTDDADRLGIDVERYVLVHYAERQRAGVSVAIADLAGSTAIRFRSPAETTWLRHGDAVSPPLFVKLAYGEFAYRDDRGRAIEIQSDWIDRNIVTASVPLLGEVRCHRATIEPLRAVLTQLAEANLGHLVSQGGFAGCWSPRRIDVGQPISRHAWGIAVDLNIATNPRGSFSTQDSRLVDLMRSAGFTWGGTWLVPDPGHYELLAP